MAKIKKKDILDQAVYAGFLLKVYKDKAMQLSNIMRSTPKTKYCVLVQYIAMDVDLSIDYNQQQDTFHIKEKEYLFDNPIEAMNRFYFFRDRLKDLSKKNSFNVGSTQAWTYVEK